MDSKKRGLFIILAIALIIVGAVGGYVTNDFIAIPSVLLQKQQL